MKNTPDLRVKLFLFILLIALFSACSSTKFKSNPHIQTGNGSWYQLQSGESIENVALKFSLDPLKLQRQNQIYDSSDVTPGLKIFIPGVQRIEPQPISPTSTITHTSSNQMIWPSPGTLSSGYGMRHGKMHQGIDLTQDKGKNIVSAASGVVIFAGSQRGFGKTIIIDHGNGMNTLYAHSEKLYVSKGDTVKQGDLISKMGTTGKSTGIHLHFEVRKNGKPQNPLRYLVAR